MDETELNAAMEQVNAELHSRVPLGAKRHFFTGPGAMNAKTRAAAEQFLREGLTPEQAAETVYRQETEGYPLPPAPAAAG